MTASRPAANSMPSGRPSTRLTMSTIVASCPAPGAKSGRTRRARSTNNDTDDTDDPTHRRHVGSLERLCGWHRQGRESEHELDGQAKSLSAGGEHTETCAAGDQTADKVARHVEDMLAVVDHEHSFIVLKQLQAVVEQIA